MIDWEYWFWTIAWFLWVILASYGFSRWAMRRELKKYEDEHGQK